MREHVQAPAVRHADHELLDADRGRRLDQRVEHRDQGGSALEREALLPRIAHVQEFLEAVGRQDLAQDARALIGREHRVVVARLHLLLQPLAALEVGDRHVLDADRAAVGLA